MTSDQAAVLQDWSGAVQEVEVRGTTVRFFDSGSGPPLLLIHGMAGSWESWRANLPALVEHHRVIAVDLPGFGGSDALAPGTSFDEYVEVLTALLDALGIDRVALGGHSLGGLVALALASRLRSRVMCVTLVSAGGTELGVLHLALIGLVFRILRMMLVLPGVRHLLVASRMGRPVIRLAVRDPDRLDRRLLDRMFPRSAGPGFVAAVSRASAYVSQLRPSDVTAPTLLIWGEQDRILPLRLGRTLTATLPNARLVPLPGIGHCAMFEAPETFNKLCLDHLARHCAGGEGRRRETRHDVG